MQFHDARSAEKADLQDWSPSRQSDVHDGQADEFDTKVPRRTADLLGVKGRGAQPFNMRRSRAGADADSRTDSTAADTNADPSIFSTFDRRVIHAHRPNSGSIRRDDFRALEVVAVGIHLHLDLFLEQ